MSAARNLVRNNAGSIVHRDNCRIAQRCDPPLLPWDWADKADEFGWINGHPRGRMGDGSVYAIHWIRACKVCRPDRLECPRCEGDGVLAVEPGYIVCQRCGGAGWVTS